MIEDWYKNTIESAEVMPPDSVWENIQDNLDISMVWDRIDSQLSQPTPNVGFNRLWYYAAGLALLLTFSASYFYFIKKPVTSYHNARQQSSSLVNYDQNKTDQNGKIDTQNTSSNTHTKPTATIEEKKAKISSTNSSTKADTKIKSSLSLATSSKASAIGTGKSTAAIDQKKAKNISVKTKNTSKSTITNNYQNTLKESDQTTATNGTVVNSLSTTKDENLVSLNKSQDTRDNISFISESDMIQRAGEKLAQLNRRDLGFELTGLQMRYDPSGISRGLESNELPHGFFIGANASFTNVWMVNNETLSGLDKSAMHTTLPSFRYNAGILFGYSVSDYLGIQAECDFLSSYGQSYKEYLHGKYVTKSINLDYITYKLLLKNKHPFHYNSLCMSSNLIFGMSYGRLLRAQENISGENSLISQLYNSNNFSGIFGYELELRHSRWSTSTLGLRFNAGLNDVSAANTTNTDSKTRNFSFEINYALKFYLHK